MTQSQKGGWEKVLKKRLEAKKLKEAANTSAKITNFFASSSTDNAYLMKDIGDSGCTGSNSKTKPADYPIDDDDAVSANSDSEHESEGESNQLPVSEQESETEQKFPSDIGMWPSLITDGMRDYFASGEHLKLCQNIIGALETSKTKVGNEKYESRITNDFFYRRLINGEKLKREWLCYSVIYVDGSVKRRLFCSICKLFGTWNSRSGLANDGIEDWKNGLAVIEKHERGDEHKDAHMKYILRRKEVGQIDLAFQEQEISAMAYWKDVLKRVVSVVHWLGVRGLPFQGHDHEQFGNDGNGNYAGLFDLIAQYDKFLSNHIEKYGNQGIGSDSYLSKTTCEEFIELFGECVRREVLHERNKAKYFSFTADSTPDISHIDQLSIVLRYTQENGPIERFFTFVPIRKHTGKNLAEVVLSIFEANGIHIADCRGQSYDNAANMSGKYNGMQSHIKNFVPCSGHSLNLVGQGSVECVDSANRYFIFLQGLYNFMVLSTHRWNMLQDKLKEVNSPVLKRLSDTRWSAHSDAVTAIFKGYGKIRELLVEMLLSDDEKPDTKSEAAGFAETMSKFETGIMTTVWHTILSSINKTSKTLQDPKLAINSVQKYLESLSAFISELRTPESFAQFENTAKLLTGSEEYGHRKRKRKRNTLWDYEETPETEMNSSDTFRTSQFNIICDRLIYALKERMDRYKVLVDRFGFLENLRDGQQTRCEVIEAVEKVAHTYPNDIEVENAGNEFCQFR